MKLMVVTTDIDHVEPYQFLGAKQKGAEVTVLCASNCTNLELFSGNDIPVQKVAFKGKRNRGNIDTIRQAIDSFEPDIVHVLRKQALLSTIPAMSNSEAKLIAYRGIVGNLSFFDPFSLLSFLHPRIDRIVCVAEAIRAHFLKMGFGPVRLSPRKVITIHKGHVTEKYNAVPDIDLKQYGIPADYQVIGFCGAMRPRKGIDILVRAFSEMRREKVALLLVGDLRDKKAKQAIAASKKRGLIFTIGKVEQHAALSINGAIDVTTMPSIKREGLPRALIEAMGQGTPAVVTRVGGSPELVEHGNCGFVVPPGDIAAFATALDELLDEQTCSRMGEQAQKRIHNHFDVTATIERNWALYQELLSEN
ncbi:MAG: glycosyltransferase family 4 protein [Pseudomonadota bacterium]